MAAPGTDAAEGDEGRSAAAPKRATGWRVPSVVMTRPGLPPGWGDFAPAPPAPVIAGPFPLLTADTRSAVDAESTDSGTDAGVRRRRFRLRRRGRSRKRDAGAPAPDESVDIDLVALDTEEHWTDLALAALEDPGTDDDLTLVEAGASHAHPRGGPDPWSMLAEEMHAERASDHGEAGDITDLAPTDLEAEFWAEDTR